MVTDATEQMRLSPDASATGHIDADVALSVVVPCFNEEPVLVEFFDRLKAACHDAAGDSFEIVFVDDGSADGTTELLQRFVQSDTRVVAVLLTRNYGHQAALTAGLFQASGARVLILDADLQDPPELASEMMQMMDNGYDIVYGQRTSRLGESRLKKTSASLFYRTLGAMIDIEMPRDTGDFRLISRRALSALLAMPEQHRFIRGMTSWLGFSQAPLEYERDERFAGESKYPVHSMIRLAIDGITSFSILPLRFASYLGLLSALASIFLTIYALGSWLTGSAVPGWTSIIVVILMMGGVQMLIIGIMGEYVGRTYIEVKGRPLFVVDRVLDGKTAKRND